MRVRRSAGWTIALALLALLAGCTGELSTPGETLRIFGTSLPVAFVGEPYDEPIRVVGGLRPFTFALEDGELPPGLSLRNGFISGTPAETGQFTFTVTVSDANLSRTFQEFTLSVQERPPARLTLNIPATVIRRPLTVRAEVLEARQLQALRTVIRWDAERFELVPGSLRATNPRYFLLSQARDGELQVDLAVLGATIDGSARIFTFELSPRQESTLLVSAETEFLASDGKHSFTTLQEGQAPLDAEGRPVLPGAGDTPGDGGGDGSGDGSGDNGGDNGGSDPGNSPDGGDGGQP